MVMIVYVWKNLGYCAIVYLGGLQSLPQDVMHAAQLDGAGAVRRFFSISIPLLSPTTFFLLITTTLNSLQRSEEHTSELQSRGHLVCRLLLEKKNLQIKEPKLR